MKESDVIMVDEIPSQIYYELVKESAKYALISFPFTINRMSLVDVNKRIENITKGKLAEKLFEYFCIENSISVDFKTSSTPFYKADKRDFLLDDFEWDIKNNFIHHNGNKLSEFDYIDLPALIPNRHQYDQWSKRNEKYFSSSKGVRFLFTFLKSSDKNSRDQFLKINLSKEQIDFLLTLANKFKGESINKKPFEEDWFWNKMALLKNEELSLEVFDQPNLVITGFADSDLWNNFVTTDPNKDITEKSGWFQNVCSRSGNLLKFMNGTIWTRIPNATAPVSGLKKFNV